MSAQPKTPAQGQNQGQVVDLSGVAGPITLIVNHPGALSIVPAPSPETEWLFQMLTEGTASENRELHKVRPAVEKLAKHDPDKALTLLPALLRHVSPNATKSVPYDLKEAVKAVCEAHPNAITVLISTGLNSPQEAVKRFAAEQIGRTQREWDDSAYRLLELYLLHGDLFVVSQAAKAYAKWGASAAPFARKLLRRRATARTGLMVLEHLDSWLMPSCSDDPKGAEKEEQRKRVLKEAVPDLLHNKERFAHEHITALVKYVWADHDWSGYDHVAALMPEILKSIEQPGFAVPFFDWLGKATTGLNARTKKSCFPAEMFICKGRDYSAAIAERLAAFIIAHVRTNDGLTQEHVSYAYDALTFMPGVEQIRADLALQLLRLRHRVERAGNELAALIARGWRVSALPPDQVK